MIGLEHSNQDRLFFQRLKRKYAARLAYYQRTGRFPKAGPSDPWLRQEEKLLKKHSTRESMVILRRQRRGVSVSGQGDAEDSLWWLADGRLRSRDDAAKCAIPNGPGG